MSDTVSRGAAPGVLQKRHRRYLPPTAKLTYAISLREMQPDIASSRAMVTNRKHDVRDTTLGRPFGGLADSQSLAWRQLVRNAEIHHVRSVTARALPVGYASRDDQSVDRSTLGGPCHESCLSVVCDLDDRLARASIPQDLPLRKKKKRRPKRIPQTTIASNDLPITSAEPSLSASLPSTANPTPRPRPKSTRSASARSYRRKTCIE